MKKLIAFGFTFLFASQVFGGSVRDLVGPINLTADGNTGTTASPATVNAQLHVRGSTSGTKKLDLAFNTSTNNGVVSAETSTGTYAPLNLNPFGSIVSVGTTSPTSSSTFTVNAPSLPTIALMRNGVDIGYISSGAAAFAGANGADVGFQANGAHSLLLGSNGLVGLTVSNGTVGVNLGASTTPLYTFDNNGTFHSTGTALFDSAITATGGVTGNLTGTVTGNATGTALNVTGIVTETHGGTNQSTYALGDTLYSSGTNTISKLSGNTTVTKKYLNQTGNGSVSAAPVWTQPAFSDLSGSATGAQLPNPSSSTLGGVQSASPVSNQWINSISTSGVPALSQPAFSNLSGSAVDAQMPSSMAGKTFTGTTAVTGALNASGLTTLSGGTVFNTLFNASATPINALSSSGKTITEISTSSAVINGISAGTNGQSVYLANLSGGSITITNDNASASTGDKIYTGTGATITLLDKQTTQILYILDDSHWHVVGKW